MNATTEDQSAVFSQSELDAAAAEAATAERTRISSILALEEAESRPITARKLALMTDFSLDDARAFLADLPAEKPTAKTPTLAERAAGNPGFGGAGSAHADTEVTGATSAAAATARETRKAELNRKRGFGPNDGGDREE